MAPGAAKEPRGTRRRASPRSAEPAQVAAAIAEARAALSFENAIKVSSIKAGPVRDAVVHALTAAGFELSGTWLRTPLHRQLAAALDHGALVPEKSLKSHVTGATTRELNEFVSEALRRGEAKRLLRGSITLLTGADTAALTPSDAQALNRAFANVVKLLTAAAKKKAGLLPGDIRELLVPIETILALEPTPTGNAVTRHVAGNLNAVLQSIEATKEASGLSFVPKVIARLAPQFTSDAARAALMAAAEQDLVELRPEGGLGRLSPAELEQCPPGPNGTRLSWARLRKGGNSDAVVL